MFSCLLSWKKYVLLSICKVLHVFFFFFFFLILGYIEARDVGTEGRVSLAGIVQEALDSCMTQHGLDPALPASAATTLMHHLNAVRKKLLLRWE